MIRWPRPAVCVITDRRRLAPDARTVGAELAALARFLDEAIEADADLIQVRERDLEPRLLCDTVRAAVDRLARGRPRILVNDRADVALGAGAHGVHLRGDGPPADRVRAMAPAWILGRSIHLEDLPRSHPAADYLLFGSVFASPSKPDGRHTGLPALVAAVADAPVPVLAIGGVTAARAADCCRAGAAGVAGIGIFLPEGRAPGALGVGRAVHDLRAAMAPEPPNRTVDRVPVW